MLPVVQLDLVHRSAILFQNSIVSYEFKSFCMLHAVIFVLSGYPENVVNYLNSYTVKNIPTQIVILYNLQMEIHTMKKEFCWKNS